MLQEPNLDAVIDAQDAAAKSLVPAHIETGVLIPLKTTLELRDDHQCAQALITRSPVRSTSTVISLIRDMLPEEIVKGMPHLRRCAKPADLPAHLKTQFMNENAHSRQIHTGKSNWVYVLLGLEATLSQTEMAEMLSKVDGFEEGVFIASIPVPLLAPTSQIQAALWTSQFWPTMYRKNNPLGPHPSMVTRATCEITNDAPLWMAFAHEIAGRAKKSGQGEYIGACVVYRGSNGPRIVALAGDARWKQQPRKCGAGNPMAHAVLRVISMVAQKLVRAETPGQYGASFPSSSEASVCGAAVGKENEDPNRLSGPNGKSNMSMENGMPLEDLKDTENTLNPPNTQDAQARKDTGRPNANEPPGMVQCMVQDLVRDRISRNRDRGQAGQRQRMAFEPFQDKPFLREENMIFELEHPTPDGYLCHGLELYVTHEPCVMCSMAILHSRMGKVIFGSHMPLTGGLSAEDRIVDPSLNGGYHAKKDGDLPSGVGIHGLGLFWRRELNWSLLAWEWESRFPQTLSPKTHV